MSALNAGRAQQVEERDEERDLEQQREARAQRVDLLALVEGHDLLVHALLVVLVALLDLLDRRLQRLEALHRLHALEGERQDREPDREGHQDDRDAPAAVEVVVLVDQVMPELQNPLAGIDERLKDVGDVVHGLALDVGAWTEQLLVLHEVDAAVTPGVAAEQPPGGQHDTSEHTVAAHRLHGVLGAARMVLAASGDRRGDRALVEAQRGRRDRPDGASRGTAPRRRARPASASTVRRASSIACSPPSRASSPAAGRATITKSWPSRSPSEFDQKASLSRRFMRLRSTAPPSLRPTETRQARVRVVVGRARERVDDEVTARMGASLAVHALELAAAG